MKSICLLLLFSAGLVLSGCASTTKTNAIPASSPTHKVVKPPVKANKKTVKNPIAVTLYTGKQKPVKPYVILGHETVSKYNVVGIKRQEANLRDSMRHFAATQGGDAIIEITNYQDSISYTVISYKNSPNVVNKTNRA